MATEHTRVTPKHDDVAAKVIDGEAIIMNLSNGLYYSMNRVGSEIWELVDKGETLGGLTSWLVDRYQISASMAEKDVGELVGRLIAEGLVVESSGSAEAGVANVTVAPASLAYESPVLNRYEDMADLLALDPPMPGLVGPRSED